MTGVQTCALPILNAVNAAYSAYKGNTQDSDTNATTGATQHVEYTDSVSAN